MHRGVLIVKLTLLDKNFNVLVIFNAILGQFLMNSQKFSKYQLLKEKFSKYLQKLLENKKIGITFALLFVECGFERPPKRQRPAKNEEHFDKHLWQSGCEDSKSPRNYSAFSTWHCFF